MVLPLAFSSLLLFIQSHIWITTEQQSTRGFKALIVQKNIQKLDWSFQLSEAGGILSFIWTVRLMKNSFKN